MFFANCLLKHFDSNSGEEARGTRREGGNLFRVHLVMHSCFLPMAFSLDLFLSFLSFRLFQHSLAYRWAVRHEEGEVSKPGPRMNLVLKLTSLYASLPLVQAELPASPPSPSRLRADLRGGGGAERPFGSTLKFIKGLKC